MAGAIETGLISAIPALMSVFYKMQKSGKYTKKLKVVPYGTETPSVY